MFTTIQKFLPDEKARTSIRCCPTGGTSSSSPTKPTAASTTSSTASPGTCATRCRTRRSSASPARRSRRTDKNTRAVFGDYISIYDIQRAVKDGATVPIYYESRLAKLELTRPKRPKLDADFEEATEGEEVEHKEKLKTQVGGAGSAGRRGEAHRADRRGPGEALRGAAGGDGRQGDGRLHEPAHLRRPVQRDREAAAGLAPRRRRQGHHQDRDDRLGRPTRSDWQPHIRNKPRREELAKRFKDAKDPFKLVIVRDMWLTGFDAPCLHTMYVDKPMRGHGLMQAIARVNRVFKDKPGGLVVDYLGLADELKQALANYTESGGTGRTAIDQEEAVAVMLEKYEICCGIFHGFDWSAWTTGRPTAATVAVLPARRSTSWRRTTARSGCVKAVTELSKAFALAVPHDEAMAIRDDVGFFQAVKAVLTKSAAGDRREP